MIRALKFKPFEKNTLIGFVDLELVKTGLVIRAAPRCSEGQ